VNIRIAAATLLMAASITGVAQVGKSETLLYPNQVTKAELAALPGLNESLAEKIIDNRPYMYMHQLNALLEGDLDEEARTELYTRLFEPINLNTATEVEIKFVPGVGDRMTHEFLEYRPYENLARFHREIGKYVDDDELARLEQFVFVPVDLNTASDEDILSIPGAGNRMVREFKEYRPWKTQAQFEKEIGKYVGAKEVARLWRYVVIE
jgi:DNA uptake protein ComE-like DNA-binding protein